MKNYLLLIIALWTFSINAQTNRSSWTVDYSKSKSFIENKGQFDQNQTSETGQIKYAVDFGSTRIFFGEKGISYSFHEVLKKSKEERLELMNKPVKTFDDHKQKERLAGKFYIKSDEVNMHWDKPNKNVQLEGAGETKDYHSYTITNENGEIENINFVKGYTKIVYKNLYPNIDVEYKVHPQIGVKYAFVLHPGADPSQIKMLFDRDLSLINEEVHISTLFGDIIDHAPITFYKSNSEKIIASNYKLEAQILQFELAQYDATQTVIIDPWVQTPAFNTDWDVLWELDKDPMGNVYVIGGVMPLQLLKYNSVGALQWTYNTPYDTTSWMGTMATDNLGNTYVTNGTDYKIQKINTAGGLIWNNNSPSGGQISTEFWNISFNCDQTKLLIGGTGGNLDIHGKVYDIDMNSGNINSSVQVTAPGDLFSIPPSIQEVRAMCPAPNGKYYFLTLDTIGYLNDNLSLCPNGSSSLYRANNGIGWGYKSENYRYNNTGIKAIRADANFVFVNKGNQIQKRSLADGSLIASATIPNGILQSVFLGGNQSHNSGTDIDDCGNVYVGSKTGVYKFDSNLNLLGNFPTAYAVYDVRVSTGGDVIACGGTGTSSTSVRSGGVSSFAAAACAPIAFTCCDATICIPQSLCQTDPPISLTTSSAGGTWSGTGVDAFGNFDPAISGPGVFNITYTLLCGSETIAITVDPCTTIDICEETNGTLSASNGNGTYTWYEGVVTPSTTPISTEQQCIDCPAATPQYFAGFYIGCDLSNCPVMDTVWTQYATGTNAPAPSAYPIQIVDGNGVTTVIDSQASLVPCSGNPCTGVTITMNIVSQDDPDCFGGNDGSATVDASGGTSPYSYSWNPGALSGATQNSLTANIYTVTILDNIGCTGSGTVTINEPNELIASAVSTPAACGLNDGTATGSATGGTGSYSYSWSPSGGSNALATGLGPNTYTVTVTDQNLCSSDAIVDVTASGGPTILLDDSSDVLCAGGNDGTATVSATGGTGGYTYSWMPGSLSGASQSTLTANSYTVIVTDGGGCTDNIVVVINEPAPLQLSVSAIDSANCGASDGSATIDVIGGTGTYTYAWSPTGGSNPTAVNIPGGAYSIVVTDQNGCSDNIALTVPNIGGPVVTILSSTDVTCFGLSDGAAEVSVSGGSTPYSYSWSPSGGNASTASNLIAGTYTITVTDGSGCVGGEVVIIGEPSEIILSETINDENCGQVDGSIALSVSGGNPTYSYLWSPNAETTSSISGLSTGTYGVTVTDNDGCSVLANYTILSVGSLTVIATPTSSTITSGESVQLNATGAVSYIWTPIDGLDCTNCPDPIATPSITTTYIVTGTDASGCAGSDTVTIFIMQECGDLFVPNIFSPNEDSNNDMLCVYGGCIEVLKYGIYSRWGELVFETDSVDKCWDGTYKGKPMMSGVYAYKLYAKLINGDVVEESGNVTLVR